MSISSLLTKSISFKKYDHPQVVYNLLEWSFKVLNGYLRQDDQNIDITPI